MAEAAVAPTLGDALAAARERLVVTGCDTPRLDAELLLCEALGGAGRERLVLDRAVSLDEGAAERFERLLARREAREPVAYILGRRAFRRLVLEVDHRVLIPRPETELLVEAALSLPRGARVLDVGAGSGAVALALADERRDLRVRGTDISADAVSVARGNAARLGLDVSFTVCDLLDGEPCDAVVANLPYVAVGEPLAEEISIYEPAGALFAGADGLDLVRRLIAELTVSGAPAFVALEIDPRQAAEVAGLVRDAGWPWVEVLRDLAGDERVVVGRA
ncbi:MAG: peptide chain release factor N(5)-glutamine methyltransferase [Solirubrobacteraceae bacterium]